MCTEGPEGEHILQLCSGEEPGFPTRRSRPARLTPALRALILSLPSALVIASFMVCVL